MMNPDRNMARGKTHEAPIAKLLAVALLSALLGRVSLRLQRWNIRLHQMDTSHNSAPGSLK